MYSTKEGVKVFDSEGEINRSVGWFPRSVSWPFNMGEIESADYNQLLEWYRFLPSSQNKEQMDMINRIIERLFSGRRIA